MAQKIRLRHHSGYTLYCMFTGDKLVSPDPVFVNTKSTMVLFSPMDEIYYISSDFKKMLVEKGVDVEDDLDEWIDLLDDDYVLITIDSSQGPFSDYGSYILHYPS